MPRARRLLPFWLQSKLALPALPRAAQADPERQKYQSEIEPERSALDVDEIVAELLTPRHVARRVDLRDPGEARLHAGACVIPRNLLHRDDASIAGGVDLAGTQRARADEAHVAAEDVHELRELVHRGGAQEPPGSRHARVPLDRLHRSPLPLRIRNHGPELEDGEPRAADAHALLPVEHGAAVLDL